MLQLTIPAREVYVEESNEFISIKECTLSLEHSLVSISKWESKWHKPFLSNKDKSEEMIRDYVRCMTLTQNVDPNVYKAIGINEMKVIGEYINDPMTATWFSNQRQEGAAPHRNEVITSEVIYYQMIALEIPFECQKWHLNRLMTLIKVVSEKNKPTKKMGGAEWAKQRSALNASRRKSAHSRG